MLHRLDDHLSYLTHVSGIYVGNAGFWDARGSLQTTYETSKNDNELMSSLRGSAAIYVSPNMEWKFRVHQKLQVERVFGSLMP